MVVLASQDKRKNLSGTLLIEDLVLRVNIGIDPHELRHRQLVRVKMGVEIDMQSVIASDKIGDTLNYATLVKQIMAYIESKTYAMLEVLVEDILVFICRDNRVKAAEVSVKKLQVGLCGAGVTVMRSYLRSEAVKS